MSQDSRKIAAQVIDQVLKQKSFSRHALSDALDKSSLSERDKAFCTELVYGTLRWFPVLESSLLRAMERPNPKLARDSHLLIAAYQLQHLQDTIPEYAAVSSAVQLFKSKRPGLAGFANAILRRLGSSPHLSLSPETQDLESIHAALGLPIFLLKALPQEELLKAALAMNDRPSRWYWNPEASGEHPFVPTASRTPTPWVQDPASQIAALLVDARPGQYVIDACAAPGSKSRILKQAVGISGHVLAVDQNAKRLSLVDSGIEKQEGDLRTLDLEQADAVLLDAPCSGYGTLRRHPEIKIWAKNIQGVIELQTELLDTAVRFVKPGGILVYSVCSPLPEEGVHQIQVFLKKHPEFQVEDPQKILPWLPDRAVDFQKQVHLWPHKDECDAFFALRLRKS